MVLSKDSSSPYVEAYSRFLALLSAVNQMPGMADFGAHEKALFDEVLLAWSNRTPLTVRQIIHMDHLGSPATLHKRLTRLRDLGWVDASSEARDRRTKYLSPTAKGLEYAENLGKACALMGQAS